MQTLIKNVKSIFNAKAVNNQTTDCNYTNNYYGDQLCGAQSNAAKPIN